MAPLRAGRSRPGGRLFFVATKPRARASNRPMFDLTLDGPVARLRLDRPEARNAIPAARLGRARAQHAARRRRRAPACSSSPAPARPSAPAPTSRISRPSPPIPAARPPSAWSCAGAGRGPRFGDRHHRSRRRPLLRRRSRPRHGLRPAGRGAGRPLRDHSGQVRHLLPAGGRRPPRRPGRAGPGVASAARRRQPRSAEAARIGLVELASRRGRRRGRRARRARSAPTAPKASPCSSAPSASPPAESAGTRSRTAASTRCSARPSSANGWRRFGRAADLPVRRQ